jgi:hypothetical protein
LRRKFWNDPNPFLHFRDYLPFEGVLVLYSYDLQFLLPNDDLYHFWLKLACWFWKRFLNDPIEFSRIFPLWRLLLPRIICIKFDWNWPTGSGKEQSKKTPKTSCSVLLLFCYYFHMGRGVVHHLNNFEFLSHKDTGDYIARFHIYYV